LSAAPQRILHEEQTLERHLSRNPILKTEMMRPDVDAGACSEIVIRQLRDQSIRAFDREEVEKSRVVAFRDPADLKR
jgi:hypothetical protein